MGFAAAGANIVLAVEGDKWASATHQANHPEALVLNETITPTWDIRSKLEGNTCDILIGGPPCKGWSTLGHRADDERRQANNACVQHFLRQVELLLPPVVLMENVRGLAVRDGGLHLAAAKARLAQAGYVASTYDVRAADFGVPQLRHRVFLIGIKHELRLNFVLKPTHRKTQWRSVWNAIGDLPPLGAGEKAMAYSRRPTTTLQRRLRRGCRLLTLHQAPNHSPRIRSILQAMAEEGASRADFEERLGLTTGFHNTYCRLKSDMPAPAVTSSAGRVSSGRNAHPFDDRALTPREAARLQTFPDTYHWKGPGLWNIYEQIGNAVPPMLAEAVATQLMTVLGPSLALPTHAAVGRGT